LDGFFFVIFLSKRRTLISSLTIWASFEPQHYFVKSSNIRYFRFRHLQLTPTIYNAITTLSETHESWYLIGQFRRFVGYRGVCCSKSRVRHVCSAVSYRTRFRNTGVTSILWRGHIKKSYDVIIWQNSGLLRFCKLITKRIQVLISPL
jgi:hypothetical protein